MVQDDRVYFPLASRLKVPAIAAGVPGLATITLTPQAKILDSVILCVATAGFNGSDAGVRISGQDGRLYPDMGSVNDSNFAGLDIFGCLLPSSVALELPFNRTMQGTPYSVKFEFSNSSAGILAVNIVLICARKIGPQIKIEMKEKESV